MKTIKYILLSLLSLSVVLLGFIYINRVTKDIHANQPIEISTVEDLNDIVRTDLNGNYILVNDIDLEEEGEWDPLGSSANAFSGVFDGGGHIIKNLTIDIDDNSSIGFIAHNTGTIKNLGIEEGSVKGVDQVGAIAGTNTGTISNSYATANIEGRYEVGGLVGSNSGEINNSYSTGSVEGTNKVGGLVGYQGGNTISNSYSTGEVTGSSDLGGLVGFQQTGTISNSFWDTDTSGDGAPVGDENGKTTTEMQDYSTYSATWSIVTIDNFNPSTSWYIDNENDYPRLSWQFPLKVNTLDAEDITISSVLLKGNIQGLEELGITEVNVYFEYRPIDEGDDWSEAESTEPEELQDGSPLDFSKEVVDLLPNITYQYRVVATWGTSGDEAIIYGKILSFTTLSVIKTQEATNVEYTSAILNAEIFNLEGEPNSVYFMYALSSSNDPASWIETDEAQKEEGTYSYYLQSLDFGTEYKYYVVVNYGIENFLAFGEIETFTTKSPTVAINTGEAENITATSVHLKGDIIELEGTNIEEAYFQYKLQSAGTWIDITAEKLETDEEYVAYLSGLLPNKEYEYRFVVKDTEDNIKEGNTILFSTSTIEYQDINSNVNDIEEWNNTEKELSFEVPNIGTITFAKGLNFTLDNRIDELPLVDEYINIEYDSTKNIFTVSLNSSFLPYLSNNSAIITFKGVVSRLGLDGITEENFKDFFKITVYDDNGKLVANTSSYYNWDLATYDEETDTLTLPVNHFSEYVLGVADQDKTEEGKELSTTEEEKKKDITDSLPETGMNILPFIISSIVLLLTGLLLQKRRHSLK